MSKKGVSPATIDIIKEDSQKGHSANYIQKHLKREHRGIRRTQLLTYVREFKGRAPKAEAHIKYTPHKYRGGTTYKTHYRIFDHYEKEKYVAVYGRVNGQSRRIEVSGTGKELGDFLSDAIHHPPKERFARGDAGTIHGRAEIKLDYRKTWDRRPRIES